MTRARGYGAGKLILAGEHAVVYGHPAVAFAVDRGTTVTLEPRPGPTEVLSAPCDERLRAALRRALGEGFAVHVTTDLPIGRGMGSSAALALALVEARAALAGRPLSPEAHFQEALEVERVFHGQPSGLDVAVGLTGGLVRYRRPRPGEALAASLERLGPVDWCVVVLDSGEAGDTAELVARVAAGRPANDPLLAEIGALVEEVALSLSIPDRLGPLLTHNHRLLQRLGVSTPQLDALVDLALRSGAAGAKLAGAGGGGVALALFPDPTSAEGLMKGATQRGLRPLLCRPGP
jgi:mevalonate kinase